MDMAWLEPLAMIAIAGASGAATTIGFAGRFLSPQIATRVEAHLARAVEVVRDDFELHRTRREAYRELLSRTYLMLQDAEQDLREANATHAGLNNGSTDPASVAKVRENLMDFVCLVGWAGVALDEAGAKTAYDLQDALQRAEDELTSDNVEYGPMFDHYLSYCAARVKVLSSGYAELAKSGRVSLSSPKSR